MFFDLHKIALCPAPRSRPPVPRRPLLSRSVRSSLAVGPRVRRSTMPFATLLLIITVSVFWPASSPAQTEPAETEVTPTEAPQTDASAPETSAGDVPPEVPAEAATPPAEPAVAAATAAPPPPPAIPVPPHPLTLPRFGSSDVDSFFHINLKTGDTYLTDGLDGPPLRTRRLGQNISREIGLATGMSIGDLLLGPIRNGDGSLKAAILVESSTGYVAFLDDIGRGGNLGTISVAVDRPFQTLANTDRSLSLLMRRDSSGRTTGAYLYQATSGRALYLGGLRKLDPTAAVVATVPWPTLSRRATAVEIQSSREETTGYWIADPATGDNYRINLSRDAPARLTGSKLTVNIYDAIAKEGPHATYDPLVALGIEDRSDRTRHLFLLSVKSGEIAIWYDIAGDDGRPRLARLSRNLYDVLGREPAQTPRTIAAFPKLGDNGVEGIYLLDSVTRGVILIADLDQPSTVTLSHLGPFGN